MNALFQFQHRPISFILQLIEFTDSSPNPATVPSAVPVQKRLCHKLLPKTLDEFGQKPFPLRCLSKPVLPPKTLPKTRERLTPSRSLSKPLPPPKPGTQSTLAKHCSKSKHTVAKTTEKNS